MAIIYSYPTAAATLSTLLLGSAHDAETGTNITKQFSVGDIASLIADEYIVVSSLTTTGTTGNATLVSGVLNIPNYTYDPGYRMYTTYLTQTGSSAPTKTVLFNDVNGTVEFARTATGTYTCTITGTDTFDTAWYSITDNRFALGVDQNYMVVNKTSPTVITIYTYKAGVLSDGLLLNTPFEIKIFD
jgi:hypothetical protein